MMTSGFESLGLCDRWVGDLPIDATPLSTGETEQGDDSIRKALPKTEAQNYIATVNRTLGKLRHERFRVLDGVSSLLQRQHRCQTLRIHSQSRSLPLA